MEFIASRLGDFCRGGGRLTLGTLIIDPASERMCRKSDEKSSLGKNTVYQLTEDSKRRTRLSVGSTSLFINQSSNLSELLRQHKFISNCAICYLGKTGKSSFSFVNVASNYFT